MSRRGRYIYSGVWDRPRGRYADMEDELEYESRPRFVRPRSNSRGRIAAKEQAKTPQPTKQKEKTTQGTKSKPTTQTKTIPYADISSIDDGVVSLFQDSKLIGATAELKRVSLKICVVGYSPILYLTCVMPTSTDEYSAVVNDDCGLVSPDIAHFRSLFDVVPISALFSLRGKISCPTVNKMKVNSNSLAVVRSDKASNPLKSIITPTSEQKGDEEGEGEGEET